MAQVSLLSTFVVQGLGRLDNQLKRYCTHLISSSVVILMHIADAISPVLQPFLLIWVVWNSAPHCISLLLLLLALAIICDLMYIHFPYMQGLFLSVFVSVSMSAFTFHGVYGVCSLFLCNLFLTAQFQYILRVCGYIAFQCISFIDYTNHLQYFFNSKNLKDDCSNMSSCCVYAQYLQFYNNGFLCWTAFSSVVG